MSAGRDCHACEAVLQVVADRAGSVCSPSCLGRRTGSSESLASGTLSLLGELRRQAYSVAPPDQTPVIAVEFITSVINSTPSTSTREEQLQDGHDESRPLGWERLEKHEKTQDYLGDACITQLNRTRLFPDSSAAVRELDHEPEDEIPEPLHFPDHVGPPC